MLDILYAIFQSIIHGITTILNMIVSIPQYVNYVSGVISLIPSVIFVPLTIVVTASVVIAIKRLVI